MAGRPLPRITINPDGTIAAGDFRLVASHPHYRKRLAYWRVLDASGRPLSGWRLTPRLALLAVRRAAEPVPGASGGAFLLTTSSIKRTIRETIALHSLTLTECKVPISQPIYLMLDVASYDTKPPKMQRGQRFAPPD